MRHSCPTSYYRWSLCQSVQMSSFYAFKYTLISLLHLTIASCTRCRSPSPNVQHCAPSCCVVHLLGIVLPLVVHLLDVLLCSLLLCCPPTWHYAPSCCPAAWASRRPLLCHLCWIVLLVICVIDIVRSGHTLAVPIYNMRFCKVILKILFIGPKSVRKSDE